MASDNIFSGLKVVDLASFIAGPSAAVILSDFGAVRTKKEKMDHALSLPHHDGTGQIKDRRAPEATNPHALHWI